MWRGIWGTFPSIFPVGKTQGKVHWRRRDITFQCHASHPEKHGLALAPPGLLKYN
jgi:hypothetical protein